MTTLRRLSYAATVVAFLHVVFGAIVRISGSGMGCGDHWPKCYGHWFPPFTRPDLVIEVLHRYFAATLITVVVALLAVALLRRRTPGVGGRGGVLRAAALASGLVTFAAAFGAVTVRFANAPWATVTHKGIAAALLAALAAATVRAGGFGAARATLAPVSGRTVRAAYAAAGLAIVAVLMGGLTAKVTAGAVACRGFPFCGAGSLGGGAQHVQLTHRVVAYLLAIHLIALAVLITRRRETGPVAVAARVAAGVVVLQIALGAAMVLIRFYPVLRSLHQATGITLWLATFVMAYLARRGSRPGDPAPLEERAPAPRPGRSRAPVTALGRAGAGHARSAHDAPAGSLLALPEAPRAELAEVELAVANGASIRPFAAAGRPAGPVPPRLLQLVGAPRQVVHAEPLRRGAARDRRRGRDASGRPFRVIDGRVRPTAAPLPLPAPRRALVPARSTPPAVPALPATPAAHEPGFDLAHGGPEFTIVVWTAVPAVASGEVAAPPASAAADARHQALRRFAESFRTPAGAPVVPDAADGEGAAAPDLAAAAAAGDAVAAIAAGAILVDAAAVDAIVVCEAPVELALGRPAAAPSAADAVVVHAEATCDVVCDVVGDEAVAPHEAPLVRGVATPDVVGDAVSAGAELMASLHAGSDAAWDAITVDVGERAEPVDGVVAVAAGAPSVAAVRRARRYSVALLVARGADL